MNVHVAKTHLSRLLERVAGGDEIIITRSGNPIARLFAFNKSERPLGFVNATIDAGK